MFNKTPLPLPKPAPIDMQAVFEKFADAAAYRGFVVEIDNEIDQPSGVLFCCSSHEDQRVWVQGLFEGVQDTTCRFVVIDAFRKSMYAVEDVSEYKRVNFYRGTIDLADLDFFKKLLTSIFPE